MVHDRGSTKPESIFPTNIEFISDFMPTHTEPKHGN